MPRSSVAIVLLGIACLTMVLPVSADPDPFLAWTIPDIAVTPSGYQPAGTPVKVSFTVLFDGLGDVTFPSITPCSSQPILTIRRGMSSLS